MGNIHILSNLRYGGMMARQWALELSRHGLTSQIVQLLCDLSETTPL